MKYPFNLDDVNKCGLYIKVEISIVHKKQPPFFMYVKEDSDMLRYRHSQGQAPPPTTGNNLYMPDAYGRGRSYEIRTERHRYTLWSGADVICLLCAMHPAIFFAAAFGAWQLDHYIC